MNGVYVVKAGDTFTSIAAKHGVSVSELQKANSKTNAKKLQIGQMLAMPNNTPANIIKQTSATTNPVKNNTYIIKSGDTLSHIAQRNGISTAELISANPSIKPDKLRPGQSISLPLKAQQVSQPNNPTVQAKVPSALNNITVLNSNPKQFGLNCKPAVQNPYISSMQSIPNINDEYQKLNFNNNNQNAHARIKEEALKIAVDFAKEKEAFRANVYKCPSGRKTIGYGHRVLPDEKFKTITKKEALTLLNKDLEKAYNGICKALGDKVNNLNSSQLAALASMAFNSGEHAVTTSKYFELVKQGKYDEAQAHMDAVYGNKTTRDGQIVRDKEGKAVKEIKNGLLIRRIEEMKMFGNGTLSAPAKKRILELINQSFATTYTDLDKAIELLKKELLTLETKNARKKPPLSQSEKNKLTKLRNSQGIFKALETNKALAAN